MVLKVKKQKFQGNDSPISINDIDINKIVVSNKLPFRKQGFINFVGQKDDKKKIRPLCTFFPKGSAYRIDFDEAECMYFMIKEENFLIKYGNLGKNQQYNKKKINSALTYSK